MNQILWDSVGRIGDDLISDADSENVKRHFSKKKQNRWIKYISIAACLCLAVLVYIPLTGLVSENTEQGHQAPESDPNDKSISSFADLKFNCINAYTDEYGNDILLFDIHIDRWIKNTDGYVKQLYIRSESDGIIGIIAFGRELQTEQINGEKYFVLDTAKVNSVYNLDLYLSLKYSPGALIRSESYGDTNNLTVYLNGRDEDCRGEIKFYFHERNDEKPVILTDTEALRKLTDAILPTVFPTDATLVNQIFWYPENGFFTISYRTDSLHESYTVSRRTGKVAYGDRATKTYFYNGTEYTVITDEAGYEYPPFHIDFEVSGYCYSITVDVRQPVDPMEIIRGLSAE